MSGHNKWSGIKHRKGAQDAKRASSFTKLGRLISIAAKESGGNPESNMKLKFAIDQARRVNMPKDNIERAIKKGTGELKDGAEIEEIIYEAFGSSGVMMLIKTATDNKNRTLGEIKNIIIKGGGKMASAGGVMHSFKLVGNINISVNSGNLDEMELVAIEAGAEDTIYWDETLTIYTKATELKTVKENLEKSGISVENAELVYAALQKVELDENARMDYEKILEQLDDNDDVQEVYDNL
ncbi:MAG: putative transcriptional regulatory protein [Parcubacteria group bacterium Athens0714_25]|uniref:Probable transcriptional regulatory protein Athens101428_115 n=1 Tax=Candidatus Berkelbacteria bacterium Athens1014_28 TaxID=2017145 RepID=A0A554LQL8_9BACT|nr:MAG: putative transcriptional regulatory protein [Candidatus Berkelbacteria bacterium Athens1014_28]TSD02038.1 MAG: putative transcriptional regulatory protein [Parcubacteria group bacterium Athens0714_25]